jgi:murein DD-endopeptidase MepM/ murein hydrolase activator NlpD
MKIKKPNKNDKVRLVYFSTGDSDIRQIDFSLFKFFLSVGSTALIIIGLFFTSVTICNRLYQHNTNSHVAKTNKFLKGKIKTFQNNIENLNKKLLVLEEETEDLGILVGLSSTETENDTMIKNLLSENNIVMTSAPIAYEYNTDKVSEYMNRLEARIERTARLQEIIEDKFLQTQEEIKHIPSIRPVPEGRVTDKFGKRKDPFIEKVKHHNGIDLSARYGTKVYAAADGVVEFIRQRYRLNKGYGRVIIINHGYGYKTLYGHLKTILVKPGEKVERWQVIGLSGDTGRATGPHLHYEVWHHGRPQNPEDFILN